jgi:Cu/Ag efflux protein CusF
MPQLPLDRTLEEKFVWSSFRRHCLFHRAHMPRSSSALVVLATVLTLVAVAAATGCRSSAPHVVLHGEVTKKKLEEKAIVVKGDDIPGFMPAMTMQYEVRGSGIPANLQVGDVISADVVFAPDGKHYWLENIRVVTPAPAKP